jgi:hypothetical protein
MKTIPSFRILRMKLFFFIVFLLYSGIGLKSLYLLKEGLVTTLRWNTLCENHPEFNPSKH